MKNQSYLVLLVIAIGLLLGGTCYWNVLQWHECRAMDFSVLYCLKHVF